MSRCLQLTFKWFRKKEKNLCLWREKNKANMTKCQQLVSPEVGCRYFCRTSLSTFPKLKVGIKNTCIRPPTRTGALKEVRTHAAERERNRSQGVELKNEGDGTVRSSQLKSWSSAAPERHGLHSGIC